jgi:hypothetical protein
MAAILRLMLMLIGTIRIIAATMMLHHFLHLMAGKTVGGVILFMHSRLHGVWRNTAITIINSYLAQTVKRRQADHQY